VMHRTCQVSNNLTGFYFCGLSLLELCGIMFALPVA